MGKKPKKKKKNRHRRLLKAASKAGLKLKPGSTYKKRDATLLLMGFATYKDYLRSKLWAGIRWQVMQRDGSSCVACKKAATQVHHTDYERPTLEGFCLDGLVAICGGCHETIEYHPAKDDDTRRKCNMAEANAALAALISRYEYEINYAKCQRCKNGFHRKNLSNLQLCGSCTRAIGEKPPRSNPKPQQPASVRPTLPAAPPSAKSARRALREEVAARSKANPLPILRPTQGGSRPLARFV